MAATTSEIDTSALDRGVTWVRLTGEIDAARAPALKESFDALVRDGHHRLLVDLSEVAFIDSTGLGVLLQTVRELRGKRGRLAVCCPAPATRELFELVGHNLLFPVEDTRERALRHLAPARRFFPRRTGMRA
jgi:anti-sigma B factor antagonist